MTLSATYVSLAPFGGTYCIGSEDGLLIDVLTRIFSNFVVDASPAADCQLTIRLGATPATYRLYQDKALVLDAALRNDVIVSVIEIVQNHRLLKQGYWPLHGAALRGTTGAILFPGGTRSGKSTLAWFLASKGYGFLSDDTAVVDCATLGIVACPYSVGLREGMTDLFADDGMVAEPLACLEWNGQKKWLYQRTLPQSWRSREDLPVAAVFLRYDAGAPATFCCASRVEALKGFLLNSLTPDHMALNRRMAAQLAARMPAYRLVYPSLEEAYCLLSPTLATAGESI